MGGYSYSEIGFLLFAKASNASFMVKIKIIKIYLTVIP